MFIRGAIHALKTETGYEFQAAGNHYQVNLRTNRITYSGPDGAGVRLGPDYALGHRRLKIVDLSDHGAQPMPTPEDMASTYASNAEARAKAIADGLDEGTANIMYPEFSTPEDMLKIN